jgi:hypothetical protein
MLIAVVGPYTPIFNRRDFQGMLPPEVHAYLSAVVVGILDDADTVVSTGVVVGPNRVLMAHHDGQLPVGKPLTGVLKRMPGPQGVSAREKLDLTIVAFNEQLDVAVARINGNPRRVFAPIFDFETRPAHTKELLRSIVGMNAHIFTSASFIIKNGGWGPQPDVLDGHTFASLEILAVGENQVHYNFATGKGDSGAPIFSCHGAVICQHMLGWGGADSVPPSATGSAGGAVPTPARGATAAAAAAAVPEVEEEYDPVPAGATTIKVPGMPSKYWRCYDPFTHYV